MEGCQPLLLVVMDLAYQDQGVAHQNAGQRNQPDEGIDAKRLVEEQRIDDRLQRLRDGGRNIRRLQIFGYISPDSYGRNTIATAHNRLFHLHLNLANLRQRNALPGSPHQGKAGNFCRVKPDIPRRASHDLYRTDIFPYRGDRNP